MRTILLITLTLTLFSCSIEQENNSEIVSEDSLSIAASQDISMSNIYTTSLDTLNWTHLINNLNIAIKDSLINIEIRNIYKDLLPELTLCKENSKNIFPYSNFDSIVFISHSKVNEFTLPVEKRKIVRQFEISHSKAKKLLNIINNPLNFDLWECETTIPSERVIFYLDNKIIAELQFACAYGAVISKPSNKLIWGNFNSTGDSLIKFLEIDKN